MKLLISDGFIAGTAEGVDSSSIPLGFTIAEYPNTVPIESLYCSDGEVQPIPPKPSENCHWNGIEWVEIVLLNTAIENGPDWDGLVSNLRSSDIWEKSFKAASMSIAANSAWTLLYGTLTSTKHLQDLIFAITALRSAMAMTDEGDLSLIHI
jgi:hypothetical protein